MQDAGFNMAFKPVRVKFKPSAKDVQVCEESGVDLAQAVHRVMRVQERQAGSSQVKQGAHHFGALYCQNNPGQLCAVLAGVNCAVTFVAQIVVLWLFFAKLLLHLIVGAVLTKNEA